MDAVRSLLVGALALGAFAPPGIPLGHAAETAQIDLNAGFMPDPHALTLVAGGRDTANDLADNCAGYIDADQPTASIAYHGLAESSQLGMFTAAGSDTTLVVQAPDGRVHCNDDSDYLASGAAGLTIAPALDGIYQVWVGTASTDDAGTVATLAITEYGARMWLTLNLEAGYDGLLMNMVNNDIEFGDDSGEWANDGECDDPRFVGPGMTLMPPFDHERRDASDCRVLFGLGEIRLGRTRQQ
ncbi:MAG: hypothetical protein ACE37N_10460 [Pseudohongiellaceae bacterium]